MKLLLALLATCTLCEAAHLRAQSGPAVKDGNRVFLQLDLLVWQAHENRIAMTNGKSDVFITNQYNNHTYLHPRFDWETGSRFTLGYIFKNSLWDFELQTTSFETRMHQQRDTGSTLIGMFPVWSQAPDTLPGDYVTDARMDWKIKLYRVNLDFGRNSYEGRFYYRPYWGFSSTWIKQLGHASYDGGIFLGGTDHNTRKLNFWGMGPRMGIEPRVYLGEGFSLYVDGAATYLFGYYTFRERETYLASLLNSRDRTRIKARWFLDADGGVQWKTLFMHQRFALTFRLGWEYHFIPKAAAFMRDPFHILTRSKMLWFQGGIFSGRFDF